MSKIEVEHRGLITKEEFNRFKHFFRKNGKYLGEKKRFSLIHNTSEKSVREIKDNPVDIKLRLTNKKPELAVKYGKWSGKDARREFNFSLEPNMFDDMLELLKILGYHKFVLMANTKYDYFYHGIEFSLVKVPDWGFYFEAEILTKESFKEQADRKLDHEIVELGLKVLDEDEFYDLLDELNNRRGFRIDLYKVSLKEIKKRFSDYF